MKRKTHLLLLSVLLVMGAALAKRPPQTATAEPSRGLELYGTLYCGTCHQLTAARAAGGFGPSHDRLGQTVRARLQDPGYHGGAKSAADYIRESITDPGAYLVPEYAGSRYLMPAFGELSEDDLEALVTLLLGR